MAYNGRIKLVYDNHNRSVATFPVTVDRAVYTSEGLLVTQAYQKKLVSGTNIKTINNQSILSAGNLSLAVDDGTGLHKSDIIDTLTSLEKQKALSANQGRELKLLIDALPNAMVFKGSLGPATSEHAAGTITVLPTPSRGDSSGAGSTIGHVYEVITPGTYAGKVAEFGDLFICNDVPEWVHIPTTQPMGTVIQVDAGEGLTTGGSPITTVGSIRLEESGVLAGVYTKVKVDKYGRVLATSEGLLASDIPDLDTSKIVSGTFPDSRIASAAIWNHKVDSNSEIVGKTACKISYDSKGLVTGSDTLKITDVTGITASADEINYLDGVTSAVQTQIDGKVDKLKDAPTAGTYNRVQISASGLVVEGYTSSSEGDIPSIHLSKVVDVTASAAEVNKLKGSLMSTSELNMLVGTKSNIQNQIDSKANILAQQIQYTSEGGNLKAHLISVSEGYRYFMTIPQITTTSEGIVKKIKEVDLGLRTLGVNAEAKELNYMKGAKTNIPDAVQDLIDNKQPFLYPGVNIQTINNKSILKAGNINLVTKLTTANGIDGWSAVDNTGEMKIYLKEVPLTTNLKGISVTSTGNIEANVDEGIEIDATSHKIAHVRSMTSDTPQTTPVAAVGSATQLAVGTTVTTSASNLTFKYDEQGHINGKMYARANYGTVTLPQFTAAGSKTVSTPAAMGITANDHPWLDILVTAATSAETANEAWGKIYRAVTGAGSITFYAYEATPTALTVQIRN